MANLKYTTIVNFTLIVLNEVREIHSQRYTSLPSISELLDFDISFIEAVELADYLETKGFVTRYNIIGDVLVQIATIGLLHLEEMEDSLSQEFDSYIKELIHRKDLPKDISKTLEDYNKNSISRIKSILDNIQNKLTPKRADNFDYIADLEIIGLELSKLKPDYRILELKIDELIRYYPIAEDAIQLRNLILHSR